MEGPQGTGSGAQGTRAQGTGSGAQGTGAQKTGSNSQGTGSASAGSSSASQGTSGPQGNPGNNPNPQNQGANQPRNLPDDPLKYSQPKFTATWQVYPGMYQPGLRVMADTGMGAAEWLRHLGQPNPIPTIQAAVAPGANQGQKSSRCWMVMKVRRAVEEKKKRKSKKRKSMKKKKKR